MFKTIASCNTSSSTTEMSIFKKPYDIIFYYPQHFNRSSNGTNPFFDPLIAVCEENGLSYLLLEEPDGGTDKPKNKLAVNFTFWLYFILGLRKLLPNQIFRKNINKEIFIGKILSFFTLNKFKANTYLTISNSMINVLLGLNKNANVYDLQHGIIYSTHPGYFQSNGKLNDFLKHDRIGFLLFGKGFQELFLKNNPSLLDQKRYVIGNHSSSETGQNNLFFKKKILFTLQLTQDNKIEELIIEKQKLKIFLTDFQKTATSKNISILLRHHPRYKNAITILDILQDFPFVSITDENFENLSNIVFLHITNSSTSAFELARLSIPTVFLPNELGEKIFRDEYNYPNYDLPLDEWVKWYCSENPLFVELVEATKNWCKYYFEPFNKDLFLDLIKHNKN